MSSNIFVQSWAQIIKKAAFYGNLDIRFSIVGVYNEDATNAKSCNLNKNILLIIISPLIWRK